jgi:histidine triad (HIT) family protein
LTFEQSCVFCRIVRKQAPASTIYEDETALAFLDIRPLDIGHTLVITKKHYADIFSTPEKVLEHIYTIVQHVSLAVKKATNADGISIIQQNGKAASQDIFHLHVHVVPRFEGQKMPHFSDLKQIDRENLDAMARKIRQEL